VSSGYDIIILGSGTTAFAAALRASELGARVLMVEQSRLGGTCVNWGCIPSKTLIHKAGCYFEAVRGQPYGLNMSTAFPDCPTLMRTKRETVECLRQEHYQQVLEANERILVLQGHGAFISNRELRVGAEVLGCERFLVATGGVPRVAPIPGLSEVNYLTSYSALNLPCFPESLLILGGGVIAVEMGQMFHRFGTRVSILERGERLLKDFDPRLTSIFEDILREEGLELLFGAEARAVSARGEETALEVAVDGRPDTLSASRLMLAVGTAPATQGVGLAQAGVELDDAGFIRVDAQFRTTAAGVWAAGDVTGPPLIAPAGIREAELAVENMLLSSEGSIDHAHTPMAVFVDPELAGVGLTPAQARLRGLSVDDFFFDLDHVAKAHVVGQRRGGIVLTVERGSLRIVGVQMLAPRAADIIHEATLAVRLNLRVQDLVETIHVYPSISDGLRLAARACLKSLQGRS